MILAKAMKNLAPYTTLTILLCTLLSCGIDAKPNISESFSIWSWNVWFDQNSSRERFPKILKELTSASPDKVFLQDCSHLYE